MPAKTKLPKAPVAPVQAEELPGNPVHIPLVMEERDRLAAILKDPVFIKAWNNAEAVKPPIFPASPELFEGPLGDNRAAKALCRIQGWEMHKVALRKQAIEVPQKAAPNTDHYPDSGTLEAEIKKTLPNQK